MTTEGQRLQAEALARGAIAVAQGAAAAAIIHVRQDGTLTVACSCQEDLAHPSGREKYTLDRLNAHMQLHATAAAQGVPWDVVRAELQRRVPR